MKKAVVYFELLLDADFYYTDKIGSKEKLLAAVDTIRSKVSEYYFNGKGIKRDIEKLYWYAFDGYTGIKKDYFQFSKKYFNSNAIILCKLDTVDYMNDNVFICTLNPFFDKTNLNSNAIYDYYLNDIGKRFIKHRTDSLQFIKILYYSPVCCRNAMCRAQSSLEKIKKYLIVKFNIPANKIFTNTEIDGGESYATFNNLRTPVIEIKFSKPESF